MNTNHLVQHIFFFCQIIAHSFLNKNVLLNHILPTLLALGNRLKTTTA